MLQNPVGAIRFHLPIPQLPRSIKLYYGEPIAAMRPHYWNKFVIVDVVGYDHHGAWSCVFEIGQAGLPPLLVFQVT